MIDRHETTGAAESAPPDRTERPQSQILIVDDHPLVRRGLVALIAQDSRLAVCGEADDAATAIQQVQAMHPDLVIVDLSLKRGHGIELIKQIKAHDDGIRTLVVSIHDESVYAERSLHAGAMGYLDKQQASEHVLDAIHEVLAGNYYLSAAMTHHLLHQGIAGGQPTGPLQVDRLSDRELEVFELIGQGMTTRNIAAHLRLSGKTIETHREHIKQKLDLSNGAELACRAVQWVLENP